MESRFIHQAAEQLEGRTRGELMTLARLLERGETPEGNPTMEHPGEVSVTMGITLNLGNYQSSRIDIGITMPYDPAKKGSQNKVYETAKDWVQDRLQEEVNEVMKTKKK